MWYLASPSGPLPSCSNYSPEAKNGLAPGRYMFYIEKVKKSACLKPPGLKPLYLV